MKFEKLIMEKIINLSNRDLTDSDLVDLTRVLRESTVLEQLHLDNNDITLDNGGDFTDALASNQTLEVLSLSGNNISGQGTAWLADALGDNKSLKKIHLSHNNIDEAGCKTLAVAFMKNRGNIREVYLSNNEGTNKVSALMKEITRLKEDIDANDLSRMKEKAALKENHMMEISALKENHMKETTSLKDELKTCEKDKEELAKDLAAANKKIKSITKEKEEVQKEKEADLEWIECKLCLDFKEDMFMMMTCGHMICFACLHQGDKKEMLEKCPWCNETLKVEQCKIKKVYSMLDAKGSKTYGTRSKRKAN